MNNMAYMGQDGQTVVPKVEELLSKDLGTSGPITSSVEVEGGGVSAGSVLRDLGASVFGGNVVSDVDNIVGDHSQAHPSLHSAKPFVS